MSRTDRLRRVQNRVSLLLALVRGAVPRGRYESLLSMRRSLDFAGPLQRPSARFEDLWIELLSATLDRVFIAIERGNPGRSGYLRLGHLYRDYIQAIFAGNANPISRTTSDR